MSFAQNAGLFPHQIDIGTDQVLLVSLGEEDYRSASFLDQRLLTQQRPMQWADWSRLSELDGALPSTAQFIFHIGHVGSTLIARLLGEASDTLALREPQILRQLAELAALDGKPHSPWAPGDIDTRIAHVLRWLSRGFAPDQRALVKATSFVSEIAGNILQDGRRALFLYLSPERYIQTILAGENSRRELGVLSSGRLQRLHQRIGAEPVNLWELDEAQRAALAWTTEMTALEAASGVNVLWMDFDAFLAEPAARLAEIAAFLGVDIDSAKAQELVASPIMQQYSKAPEHGYSPQLREEVLAEAVGQRGAEIAAALEWLGGLARQHPAIAAAMERASREA